VEGCAAPSCEGAASTGKHVVDQIDQVGHMVMADAAEVDLHSSVGPSASSAVLDWDGMGHQHVQHN
jgi:hypothetical protein